jgi:glutaconyl-CoA/methylmalonyl-CoA decarboxylase subunit gamma
MTDKTREYQVEIDGEPLSVRVEAHGAVVTTALGGDDSERRPLRVLSSGPNPLVLVEGRIVTFTRGAEHRLSFGGRPTEARVRSAARAGNQAPERLGGGGRVEAPMPGRVVSVRAKVGDAVSAGAALVVVEAMKMQNELLAPRAGTVTRVLVAEGATVERGALLVELE